MKQYVIDEIRPGDHARIKTHLDEHYGVTGFEGLYRLPIAPEWLSKHQKDHDDCGPHYFALELFEDRLVCELLVRTNQRIRCDCFQYATKDQLNWLIQVVDNVFQDLHIIT
jgi:hypothetical protein